MFTSSAMSAAACSSVDSQNDRSSAAALSNVRPLASSFDHGTPRVIAMCCRAVRCCSGMRPSRADWPIVCTNSASDSFVASSPGSSSTKCVLPALSGPAYSPPHCRFHASNSSREANASTPTIVAGTAPLDRKA